MFCTTAREPLHGLTYAMLEARLSASGVAPVHARPLWNALYRGAGPLAHASFPPPLRRWVEEQVAPVPLPLPGIVADDRSSDGLTRKFLLRLEDGQTVESVLMRYRDRYTACLSTQAGCAMGCVFCATGQAGFVRHLRPEEIVAQFLTLRGELEAAGEGGGSLRNIVLMGMGEPLHNYDAVMQALEIITDPRGINLAPRHISISTVGVIPAIRRLAAEGRPYNLAVSLHGASEEERLALVPVSRRWPLGELVDACRAYHRQTGRRILFGWTLIAGVNDAPEHAERLGALLKGIDAHVNLIPLNPTGGYGGATPAREASDRFQAVLHRVGIPSTVRQRRGIDVAAGCGQLRQARQAAATVG
ncbi:MAG TPA: 23S rRNA (adenine(2503)-C(2))-methyltransferase RlmN [Chthoniobacteraceae bacterium]|nr:23S rRNA (adenine(2503)-C(2))-methyltransferase RlmN [Chthoniobacteraceae bacterium]